MQKPNYATSWRVNRTERVWLLLRWIDAGAHAIFLTLVVFVLLRSQGCGGPVAPVGIPAHDAPLSRIKMNEHSNRVIYRGYCTGEGWEVTVARPGKRLQLLERPARASEWSLVILTDYLGDPVRAADVYHDFAACTINRFTDDWQLTGNEIDDALIEVEVLRARWRALAMRG